jgi:hypothetical protein
MMFKLSAKAEKSSRFGSISLIKNKAFGWVRDLASRLRPMHPHVLSKLYAVKLSKHRRIGHV